MWVEVTMSVATEEGQRVHRFRMTDQRASLREALSYLARRLESSLDGVFLDQLSVQAHATLVTLEVIQWTSFVASKSNRGESIRHSLSTRLHALGDPSSGSYLHSPPTPTNGSGTPRPSGSNGSQEPSE